MGSLLHAAGLAAAVLATPPDTTPPSPFATAATQVVVERAMARLHAQDSAVTDYAATIRYRLSLSLGRRRWGRSPVGAVEEQEARIQWQRPNDLRVDVVGRRATSRWKDVKLESVFDRPWFVPRSVGDSVRVFSDEFPAIAPLHPLAAAGPAFYRYALVDSVGLATPDGRRTWVHQVEVVPVRAGAALVTGSLWIAAGTGEVVRFAFRYVGEGFWVAPDEGTRRDSADARFANRVLSRFLTLDADLEYAMEAGGHWMPYRQTLSGSLKLPLAGDLVIPFEATTSFRDYAINTGRAIAFELPAPDPGAPRDSLRQAARARRDSIERARRAGGIPDSLWARDYAGTWAGGRFELHRPSSTALAHYRAWGDTLVLAADPEADARRRTVEADLARLTERLPDDFTGERAVWFGAERVTDYFLWNRVQGYSLGAGVGARVPGVAFTDLHATVRYGFSDNRVTGRLAVERNGPGWRLLLAGYDDLGDVDPLSPGRNFENSLNGILAAHDNADYYRARGGSAQLDLPLGNRSDLRFQAWAERQRSTRAYARSGVNDALGGDGILPPNAPVAEGTFGGGRATYTRGSGTRLTLAADVLSGAGTTTGRAWGEFRLRAGDERGATLRLKGGAATKSLLPQVAFRAGGMHTVRGFDYGTLRGQSFWSAQLDVSPIGGSFRPVGFVDAGWAGPLDGFGRGRALVGAGLGLSVYSTLLRTGVVRFDVSRALSPGRRTLRFDIALVTVR